MRRVKATNHPSIPLPLRYHIEVVEKKRVHISRDVNLLGETAGAVAGLGLNPDQHGIGTPVLLLKSCHELE